MINNFQLMIFPRRRKLRGFRPGAGALLLALLATLNAQLSTARAFEGRLNAVVTRGGEVQTFLYTVGTNCLRVERGETDRPYTVNLVNRDSGAVTLLFPNNRSFVKLKPAAENPAGQPPGFPAMPAMPAAPAAPAVVGPTNLPGMPAPPALPQIPQMPAMPAAGGMMPPMPMMPMPGENLELTATGEKTNLLGYACEKFEIKQRGEVVDIWATTQLLPFPPYLPNQPPRFGPRMIEEQWGGLLQDKKLFPLLAVLKFENGPERLRFEVKTITPSKLTDADAKLFSPPDGYQEIRPLPF